MKRELLPVATPARTREALREMARPHRALAAGALAGLVAATAVGLATAPLLGRIVDVVVSGRGDAVDIITTTAVLLAVVAVAQGVLLAVGSGLVATLGERMLADVRERFVDRALRLPLDRVERAGSGDLTSRVSDDISVISEAVREALPAFTRSILVIVLTLAGLAVLDWRFLVAAALAVPIQLHTVWWYAGRAGPLYARQRVAIGAQQQQLLDTVGGAATVRAFRLGTDHSGRVGRASWKAVELALEAARLWTRFFGRLNLAEFIGLGAVLAVGYMLVRDGAVSVGTATAAALYFHALFNPINIALGLVDDAQAATASLARLVGVVDLPAEEQTRPAADGGRPVSVRGVRFAYEAGHEVVGGVDLDVGPGERVALVGASGAGKTTLAKLVAGIHPPTGGEIRADTVVLITQEVHVFAGPLADDLRLARPDATGDELSAALDVVGALDWVRALPDGLATEVGEGGHRLTAAQAQQLALARMVLADPPVVILDEATAEAGSAGARLLERASAAALEGRSALVVAHRLTQASAADRVVVLDAGTVVESGTHGDLLAAGGRYAALWEAWSGTRTRAPSRGGM